MNDSVDHFIGHTTKSLILVALVLVFFLFFYSMSVSQRCLCCVKYLMFVFNLIFWVSMWMNHRWWCIMLYMFEVTFWHWCDVTLPEQLGGCGLFGVGVWLSFTQAEFSSLPLSFPSLSAANLLLVAGGITMVTGFLGCLGALKEQRCLLFMVRCQHKHF